MKTIFDNTTRDELKKRINSLDENSSAVWGKMTVSQMMKHCTQWDELALGKKKYKQSFMGKLFGKMALKSMMKDEPMKKNLPTVPSFVIKENVSFIEEKQKWLQLVDEYQSYSNDGFLHPFFGQLSKEVAGIMVYKHVDHHLKQFNS